jgi:hypothetical protein
MRIGMFITRMSGFVFGRLRLMKLWGVGSGRILKKIGIGIGCDFAGFY